MLLTIVYQFVQLLGKRSEDQTEFMETKFLWLSCVEIYHMVVLHLSTASEVIDIFWSNISFVSNID